MKITRIEPILLNMPLNLEGHEVPMSGGIPRREMSALLLRVETDAGITGWGEAFALSGGMATHAALQHIIAPRVVGRDATQIAPLMRELFRGLYSTGRSGPVMYGLSALDIALWDIAGKRLNQPVHQLLGGTARKSLPAYASLMRYGKVDAVKRYVQAALDQGYRYIKLHEHHVDTVGAGREQAGPGIPIMVDCNCPWTLNEALDMSQRLLEMDITWLEEPIYPPDDHAALARLRREGPLPVAAGENVANLMEFKQLFEAGALNYAQPSITKIGGISEMRKIFALAETYNVHVVPHSPYFGPGLLASMHVCATAIQETWIERYFAEFTSQPFGDYLKPVNGELMLPQGPGLGSDPDLKIIEKLRVA